MKDKLISTIRKLQNSDKKQSTVNFIYTSATGKSFSTKIQFKQDKGYSYSFQNIQGYNEKYIKNKFRSEFNSLFDSALPKLQVGDIIYTRKNKSNPGDELMLKSTDYYYGIYNRILVCDPERIRNDFNAYCTEKVESRCEPGADTVEYTLFELTKLLP